MTVSAIAANAGLFTSLDSVHPVGRIGVISGVGENDLARVSPALGPQPLSPTMRPSNSPHQHLSMLRSSRIASTSRRSVSWNRGRGTLDLPWPRRS